MKKVQKVKTSQKELARLIMASVKASESFKLDFDLYEELSKLSPKERLHVNQAADKIVRKNREKRLAKISARRPIYIYPPKIRRAA